jgi:hypothetical protein
VIDFPNPSYPGPSFEVRRIEVYLHVESLVERRRVEPLQIVEGHRERVFRPREYVDEAPEDQLQPVSHPEIENTICHNRK